MGLVLSLLVGGIYCLSSLFGATSWLRHTGEVRVKVALLRATLLDAETGARGYVVTGERAFLEPYERARPEWQRSFDDLRALTADNADQQGRLQRIETLVARELKNIAEMVAARQSGRAVAAVMPAMEESRRSIDEARALLADMERDEARLDALRERAATRRGEWTMTLFSAGAAASLVVITTIARQRRTSEERRRSAEDERRLLEDVFAGIDDGITMQDRSGKLIFANASAARMIGFETVEALLAAGPSEIMQHFELSDEEGRPFSAAQLPSRAVLAGRVGEPTIVRYRLRATGEEKWSLTQAYPVRNEAGAVVRAINVFRDVTRDRVADARRKFLLRVVDELSSSLDYEATLAAVARLAIPVLADWCAVDILEDGGPKRLATAHVDPAKVAAVMELERRYPSDPRAATGAPEILRTGRAQLLSVIPTELLRAAAVDAEHLRLIEDLQLSSYMGLPLLVGNRVLGVMTFAMAESRRVYTDDDLSFARALADRAALAIDNARLFREVERARAATTTQLVAEEQRRREAEEQTRFAETFVGMLGHDLRNPLNAILMNTSLLMRRADGDTKSVERIQSSASRMSNMVAQLLDLTRSRIAGGISIDRAAVDLGALVTEVVDEMSRGYAGRQIIWAGGPAPAVVDRNRLGQVVSNLVGNALEHGDPGKPVTVRLSTTASGVALAVHNEGRPIPAELLPVLFEPFRGNKMTRGERSKGLGLGLFITDQIVRAHGGRVDVSSDERSGTTFSVVLPRAEKTEGDAGSADKVAPVDRELLS